jgi:glycosyltransferase involved in cell wall biosynthesis
MPPPDRPSVSVVIPCYNQGRFLRDAIESVLRQTYPASEIFVVNDGSTDETAAVARSFPRVRYLEQRNQGAPVARNAGLHASVGDFLIFLDADDRLRPDAIAIGVEALAAHPEWAFVTGCVRVVDENGSPQYVPSQQHPTGDAYRYLLRSNYIWTPGAVMYRHDVLRAMNGFDRSAGASADYELNLRIARRFPVGGHREVVLEYRQHPGSMSSDMRYMLKSAVSVRRAERAHARRSPECLAAWRQGIAIVQADYGRRLVHQMKRDARTRGRRGRVIVSAWYLLRYHPDGLARLVRGAVRRLVAARRR